MSFSLGFFFSLFSSVIELLLKAALAGTFNNHSRKKSLNSLMKYCVLKILHHRWSYTSSVLKPPLGGYDKSYNLHVNRKRAIMTDGGVKTRPQCRLPPSIQRRSNRVMRIWGLFSMTCCFL